MKRDPLEKSFEPFFLKMKTENIPEIVINNFKYAYAGLAGGQTGLVSETEILPLKNLADIETQSSQKLTKIGKRKMHKTVMIKLNGGLGTSMGMKGAKCLLKVKESYSFLDIIIRQAQSLTPPVPVVFMNSFTTRAETLDALKAYPGMQARSLPLDFLQHKVPKIDAAGLTPAVCPENSELEWCPPGHGDIYLALVTSGMLDRLLEAGYEYAFVSNFDNLGAVLEPSILGYFIQNNLSFMLEAADRTEGDKKGGHLAQLKSGQYILREIAQCPEKDLQNFQNIRRHKYFNTNNIWLHLPSLKDVMNRNKCLLKLPMIRNRKTLNPRDPESTPVYQLETSMGSAISIFDAAAAIRVPRTRFAPVKNTNDLLAVRSDGYVLTDTFQLVPNPVRRSDQILIDLDPAWYTLIDHFESRFPFGVPSLLNCDSLAVKGDFRFGRGVTLEGCVSLFNDNGKPFEIGDSRRIQGELRAPVTFLKPASGFPAGYENGSGKRRRTKEKHRNRRSGWNLSRNQPRPGRQDRPAW